MIIFIFSNRKQTYLQFPFLSKPLKDEAPWVYNNIFFYAFCNSCGILSVTLVYCRVTNLERLQEASIFNTHIRDEEMKTQRNDTLKT